MEHPPVEDIIILVDIRAANGWLEKLLRYKQWKLDPVTGQRTDQWDPVEEWFHIVPMRRARFVDWSAVDWAKTNAQISRETGYSYQSIHKYRPPESLTPEVRHHHALTIGKYGSIPWTDLDWKGKTNAQLSRELKIGAYVVRKYRILLDAPDASRKWSIKIKQSDIDNIDWTKRDIELATEWNVSRERIRQLRALHAKPRSPDKWRQTRIMAIEKWLIEHRQEIEGKRARDVVRMIPGIVSAGSKNQCMRQSGINFNWGQHDPVLDLVNWDLPNVLLEMIWGFRFNKMGSSRYRFSKQSPRWNFRARMNRKQLTDPALLSAVEKEMETAKANGRKVPVAVVHSYFKWRAEQTLNPKHKLNNDTKV